MDATIAIIVLLTARGVFACHQTAVGRMATADGSVLIAYSNEYPGPHRPSVTRIGRSAALVPPKPECAIPRWATEVRAPFAYQRVAVRMADSGKVVPEGGLNSAGVGATFGVWNYVPRRITRADRWVKNGVGYEMWDVVLQRSANVSQALALVESMLRSCGASFAASGSFLLADPVDAWSVELISGHHWAAARVPRDSYLAQPNMLRIGEADAADTENFRLSEGIAEFAVSLGLRDEDDMGPIDIAETFGGPNLDEPWSRKRLWAITSLLSPSVSFNLESDEPTPVFAVPDEPLTVPKLRAMMAYHYENTEYDESEAEGVSPHVVAGMQPLCKSSSTYSVVMKLGCGGSSFMLVSPTAPCISTPTPFFAVQSPALEREYPTTAVRRIWGESGQSGVHGRGGNETVWDTHRRLLEAIDGTDGEDMYHSNIGGIAERRAAYESDLLLALEQWEAIETREEKAKVGSVITSRFAEMSQQLADMAYNELFTARGTLG